MIRARSRTRQDVRGARAAQRASGGVAALLLTVCADLHAAVAIVGGQVESHWPAVGAVLVSAEGGDVFCSGTAISARWVLTAAHCVDPGVIGAPSAFTFIVGSDVGSPDAVTHVVNQVIEHPGFDANDLSAGHDVAVLHIADADLPLLPFKVNSTALSNAFVGQHVVIAGYGITSGSDAGGTTFGTRRSAVVTIDYVDSAIIASAQGTPTTCGGDSGGPAFVFDSDGFPAIVGVASFGDQECQALQGFSRVDTLLTFIDAATSSQAIHGGATGEGIFRNGWEPAL